MLCHYSLEVAEELYSYRRNGVGVCIALLDVS
jgi:hypothetical protein